MRQKLLRDGANELTYEIRGIVKKAEQLQSLGHPIYWENIGDPIQKNYEIPKWITSTIAGLVQSSKSYGYTHSKGDLETRKFLAKLTNKKGGVQIGAEDILFFNGLGDAISKLYQFLLPTARIIGPSPAYSTHSSAEAAHANHNPITYQLNPENRWYPDIEDLRLKIKYNPNIVGILIINPDNPTGMVYPPQVLKDMITLAKEYDLFVVCDEIYANITYNDAETATLAELIGEVPAISMQGISKEMPWPGSRCGWMEFYNRATDKEFASLCQTLENAKMIEVCATKLPQLAIPKIMADPRYAAHLKMRAATIGKRSRIISEQLSDCSGINFNQTNGAFYNTIIFKDNVLRADQGIEIEDKEKAALLKSWCWEGMPLDQKFVYHLMAATGVCVVPVSSFCSDLLGFRVTLLEEDEQQLAYIFGQIKWGVKAFLRLDVEK